MFPSLGNLGKLREKAFDKGVLVVFFRMIPEQCVEVSIYVRFS